MSGGTGTWHGHPGRVFTGCNSGRVGSLPHRFSLLIFNFIPVLIINQITPALECRSRGYCLYISIGHIRPFLLFRSPLDVLKNYDPLFSVSRYHDFKIEHRPYNIRHHSTGNLNVMRLVIFVKDLYDPLPLSIISET